MKKVIGIALETAIAIGCTVFFIAWGIASATAEIGRRELIKQEQEVKK